MYRIASKGEVKSGWLLFHWGKTHCPGRGYVWDHHGELGVKMILKEPP